MIGEGMCSEKAADAVASTDSITVLSDLRDMGA